MVRISRPFCLHLIYIILYIYFSKGSSSGPAIIVINIMRTKENHILSGLEQYFRTINVKRAMLPINKRPKKQDNTIITILFGLSPVGAPSHLVPSVPCKNGKREKRETKEARETRELKEKIPQALEPHRTWLKHH